MGYTIRETGGKWTAIIFATLMVTSLIAMPALASGPATTADRELNNGHDSLLNPGNNGEGNGPSNNGPPGENGPPDNDGPPGHDRGEAANVTLPEFDINDTIELLAAAREDIESIEGEEETATQNGAISALNKSISEYRAQTFPDSEAAFTYQRDAYIATLDLLETADDKNTVVTANE